MKLSLFNRKNTLTALALSLSAALIFSLTPSSVDGNADAASLSKVTGLTAVKSDDDEINLTWNEVKGADGYKVYRYYSSSDSWVVVDNTNSNYSEVEELSSASLYSFKVKAYDYNGHTGASSSVLKAATEPDEVDNLTATAKNTSVGLSWSSVRRADKYQVYQYDSSSGTWKRLITTSKTSYTVSDLKSGTSYRFRVRAYREISDKKYYGDYESIKVTTTKASSKSDSKYIGVDKAKSIALKHAGLSSSSVVFTTAKFDTDDGQKVYEIEFMNGNVEYEYELRATDGTILDYDMDYDD